MSAKRSYEYARLWVPLYETAALAVLRPVYLIEAACPRCGAIEEILVGLRAVLTTPEDDMGSLRIRLKGKPRDHDCKQDRITVDAATGEVLA